MSLSDQEAASVARILLHRYHREISKKKSLSIEELFDECYVIARSSKNQKIAFIAAKHALLRLIVGESYVRSRHKPNKKSRYGLLYLSPLHDERACRVAIPQGELIMLRLDLISAISQLSDEELLLLRLRMIDELTIDQVCKTLNITTSQERRKESKLHTKLSQALVSWKDEK